MSRALRLPLGALLAEDATPRVRRIARDEREALQAESGMDAWLVHADGRERRSEVYELRFAAGVDQRSEPHLPGTEELIHCVSGRLRAGPVGEEADARAGRRRVVRGRRAARLHGRARRARAVLDALPDRRSAAVTGRPFHPAAGALR